MPIVPVQAGPRSDRMSPNRLDATRRRTGRVEHEMRGQDVDVILVRGHVRIVLRHLLHALVPIRHGDRNAVRFGRRCEVIVAGVLGEFEREFQNPVDAGAGHHRLLDHTSRSVTGNIRPPIEEYSPSVFSRTPRSRYRRACGRPAGTARPASGGPAADSHIGRTRAGTGSASPTAKYGQAPPGSRRRRKKSRRAGRPAPSNPPASSGRGVRNSRRTRNRTRRAADQSRISRRRLQHPHALRAPLPCRCRRRE